MEVIELGILTGLTIINEELAYLKKLLGKIETINSAAKTLISIN